MPPPVYIPPMQPTAVMVRADMAKEIRERMRTDPAGTLIDLGIPDDGIETITKLLYWKWREKHPEYVSAPASSTVAITPAPAITAQPSESDGDRDDERRWWCYESPRDGWGECASTRRLCNDERTDFVKLDGSTPCTGLSEQECTDIAGGIRAIQSCSRQDHVSCFQKHYVLSGNDVLACAPSIRTCKERRANALKKFTDDIRVKSECRTVD